MKRILLLLCFLLPFSLPGCTEIPVAETTIQTDATVVSELIEAPTEEPTEPQPWQAPKRGEELTYLYNEVIQNEDEVRRYYQLPQLNAVGGDTEALNRTLKELYAPMIQSALAERDPFLTDVICESERFRPYTLSILMIRKYRDGSRYYDAYTVSLADGSRMDGAAILRELGISEENFFAEASVRAGKYFDSLFPDAKHDANYECCRTLAASEKYISLRMPMYIDREGHLILISPMLSPETGTETYYCYPLQKPFE